MAARSSTISATTWCPTASSSASTTAIPGCRRSRRCSASRRIPTMRRHFEGGRRIAYGARALNEGGLQSMPKLTFPGGALVGDAAGLPQRAEDQGHPHRDEVRHAGRRGGGRGAGRRPPGRARPPIRRSCAQAGCGTNCSRVRNIRPAFAKLGMWGGLAYAGIDTYLLRGKAPWTLHHPHRRQRDADATADAAPRIDYPKPDGVLTFDRLSSVFISNTNHEENQPAHLHAERSGGADRGELGALSAARRRATARPASTRSSAPRQASRGCRSTRRTACTARPATSRTRRRTSSGSRRKAAAGRTIRAGCRGCRLLD